MMGKNNKSRKLRGSCSSNNNGIYDLMVCMPKTGSALECKLLVKELRDRLVSIGFTHMALTHTIYGRPKAEDRANIAIPDSLLGFLSSSATNNNKNSVDIETDRSGERASAKSLTRNNKKKRKLINEIPNRHAGDNKNKTICILRRLHVVIENLSDIGSFLLNGPQEELLNEYDLISICPTNDGTFQSVCSSATMVDIITLDYTSRGLGLGYRIRSNDVKAAIERGATFEIPIAPALLNLKQRKALVHSCQELKNSIGTKCRIIVSSGDRTLEGTDVGALALRMPGDLSNLFKTVMHFDEPAASMVVGLAPKQAIQRGRERRFGQPGITGNVKMMNKADWIVLGQSEDDDKPKIKKGLMNSRIKSSIVKSKKDYNGDNDGFIAM